MKAIPVIAVNYDNMDQVVSFPSVREASRYLGNEETIRKQIAKQANESSDESAIVEDVVGIDWYVQYKA